MNRRAFTLLEVLLALTLVLVLSGAVYGFLWNLLGERDRMSESAAHADAAGLVIERLEDDWLGSLAGLAGKPGIEGDTASIRVVSRGVTVPLEAGDRGAPLGDVHGSEIAWDRFAGTVRARRWHGPTPGGSFETITEGVQRLRFRYFDERSWASSFDSASAGRLPAAVEVAVWFGPPLERPETASESDPSAAADRPDDAGARAEADRGEDLDPPPTPEREPDRVRVMVIPDGPTSAWRERGSGS
ncbi:MAG: prepilin-type N-terminal cleavage/methylation domain-containing protein [Phycisphaerales bacterium]